MYKDTNIHVLRRFELCRRALGHTAVLTDLELWSLVPFYTYPSTLLYKYENLLARAQERARGECMEPHKCRPGVLCWSCQLPDPVLPVVSPKYGLIEHVSCTGNTVLRVKMTDQGGILAMARETPFSLRDSPYKTAVVILCGYLSTETPTPQPMNVHIDGSFYPGQCVLTDMVGSAEAEQIMDNFHPDWEKWAAEQYAVLIEERKRERAEDARQARRRDPGPKRREPASPELPLAEWEKELLDGGDGS